MSSKKLRIFIIHGSQHLTDHAVNGDGLVAWGFVNELARRGHEVHVATDKLDVVAVPPQNLTMIEFPRVHRNGLLHYASYMRQARMYYDKLAAAQGVDVVHQMNPVVRGLSLALLGRKIPIVLGTFVGDWGRLRTTPNYVSPKFQTRIEQFFKLLIDAIQQHFSSALILATPHALKRIALSFDVANRIEFLHHGVDTNLYNSAVLETDPPHIENRILYVGSLTIHKGVFTLAEAFFNVLQKVKSASLMFVGDGPQRERMKDRFDALGISDRVTFTGKATRTEVAGWIRSCDVLCAPSYGEPYGQNVLEAMATGKPIVITTEGGHRHIGDSAGAMSVKPGDAVQLATALTTILLDPGLARSMGLHNRAVVEQRNTWSRVTDQLEQIYERAIEARRR